MKSDWCEILEGNHDTSWAIVKPILKFNQSFLSYGIAISAIYNNSQCDLNFRQRQMAAVKECERK